MYVLIASLFVIDTVIVSTWFGLEKVKQRLVETSLSNESRDDVVYAALEAIQHQPLLGLGEAVFTRRFRPTTTERFSSFTITPTTTISSLSSSMV